MLRERAPTPPRFIGEGLDITDWIETKAARDAGYDPGVARLKILANCCRIGLLSYISQQQVSRTAFTYVVFPPVFTSDLEAEFWVAEADMQLIAVPYNL
jgi:hypothetical protein